MYVQLDRKVEEHLEGVVMAALSKDWQERTSKVLKDALDSLTYDLGDYIGTELEDYLVGHIQDVARHTAENFLKALAEGKEEQVRQFLNLPNEYWDQRKEHRLGSLYWGRDHGPLALRRKMIEAVQDRLEREVIIDQEAEIQALRNSLSKAEAELREWRTVEL